MARDNALRRALKQYLSLGLPVVPITSLSSGKCSCGRGCETPHLTMSGVYEIGHRVRSSDPDDPFNTDDVFEDAGAIGMATGRDPGDQNARNLVVLAFGATDSADVTKLTRLFGEHWRRTPTVVTTSGNRLAIFEGGGRQSFRSERGVIDGMRSHAQNDWIPLPPTGEWVEGHDPTEVAVRRLPASLTAAYLTEEGEEGGERNTALRRLLAQTPLVGKLTLGSAFVEQESPEFVVDGILHRGTVSLMVAPPKFGKSGTAVDISGSVACGLDWAGRKTTKGPVLYINADRDVFLHLRIQAWQEHNQQSSPIDMVFLNEAVDLTDREAVDELVKKAKDEFPTYSLIVIDTLSKCMGSKHENIAADGSLFMENLRDLAIRLDAAVLVLHHPSKGRKESRGSWAFAASADAEMLLSRTKGRQHLQLTSEMLRNGRPFDPIDIELIDVSGTVVAVATGGASLNTPASPLDEFTQGDESALKAITVLVEHYLESGEVLARGDWETKSGITKQTLDRRIRDLFGTGAIQQEKPRAGYAPTEEVLAAFGHGVGEEAPSAGREGSMRVMGIDPSIRATGYAVIDELEDSIDTVCVGTFESPPEENEAQRLGYLQKEMRALILDAHPAVIVVEDQFVGPNKRESMSTARAQAIVLALAVELGVPTARYAPKTIKLSIAGNGAASKQDVAAAVRTVVTIASDAPNDVTDAAALALHHLKQIAI